jgi:hypothetical protein
MQERLERGPWSLHAAALDVRTAPRTQRVELRQRDSPVAREAVGAALSTDADLRSLLTTSLRSAPFPAFFWEVAPLSPERAGAPFEYVIVDSPRLGAASADGEPFAKRFSEGAGSVISFPNLAGDARLVVPRPLGSVDAYVHLAAFVREGPSDQVDALWREVGREIERWRATRTDPVWVSTSGLAVHWLHVRLDPAPKYYTHSPYRSAEA